MCLSCSRLSFLPAGDELDKRWAEHRWPHSRTLQCSHHRSRRGGSGWWDQVRITDQQTTTTNRTQNSPVLSLSLPLCVCCLLKKHIFWLFLWFPAGAVVSSKGERGKPSRDTSERREQRELETLWSLSSFKWKQLHSPHPPRLLSPPSLSTSPLSPLFISHYSHHHCTSPLSMVLSAPLLLAG